jgi:hypothetical protein
MKTTLYLILTIVILSGCAKKETTGKLSVKGMQDDFFILWSAIKEIHPAYGIYTTTDSLQKAYDKTYALIKEPLYERDYITLIYPFLCNVRCGHTQIEHTSNNVKEPHLPFEVLVKNHHAWITTHQTKQLNTGDEIISVNDVPVSTIIHHGYDLYCDDGYNETFKELYLSEYDGFEDVCNKYYHWPGSYQLKVVTNAGEIKKIKVNEIQVNEEKHNITADTLVDNYANWTTTKTEQLRFLKNTSVALLKSTPFAYTDTIVFKDAFKEIKEKATKTLILDMRHNSGGDIRVAVKLLSYLADSSFRIVKDVKSRLPDPAINSFTKYFDTSITAGFKMGFQPTYKEGTTYKEDTSYKEDTWYHIDSKPAFGDLYGPFPLEPTDHFNGQLIVLIDGATFSSGALFSAAVKAQRKGVVFIGRETAGAEEGCNGVTLQKLTLPNTKIVIDFPWMRVISMAKHSLPGRGVMPDYPIDYSPEDIVTQNDRDLKKALSLIKI